MTDILTKEERSKRMSLVRSKNTKPEIQVRKLVYGLGYRYRLHSNDLPGHPDLVFKGRKKIIFIHGCFWHRHKNCKLARLPKSRLEFWKVKLEENHKRDVRIRKNLKEMGWKILVLWECELQKGLEIIERKVISFLDKQ